MTLYSKTSPSRSLHPDDIPQGTEVMFDGVVSNGCEVTSCVSNRYLATVLPSSSVVPSSSGSVRRSRIRRRVLSEVALQSVSSEVLEDRERTAGKQEAIS